MKIKPVDKFCVDSLQYGQESGYKIIGFQFLVRALNQEWDTHPLSTTACS